MSAPLIHGNRTVFSASAIVDAIASELSLIKSQDRLTYADLGAVLGKSEDQAAKYCDGSAVMDAVTLYRGKREWNGRFTGAADRLCVDSRPNAGNDRSCGSKVLAAALAMSVALEGDDEIVSDEVRANRATLEAARDAIDAQLAKLGPQAARVAK
ncbi:MAG TPA: hypothetical protein VF637_08015 [Sphingomicrobium sp.]